MTDLNNWLDERQRQHVRKQSAWAHALVVEGYDPNQIRKDAYGSVIVWSDYGKTTTYGWEIDHELPKAHFPTIATQPSNQRALHWRNNRTKSDKLDVNTLQRILRGLQ
jgi:hypothetical protein